LAVQWASVSQLEAVLQLEQVCASAGGAAWLLGSVSLLAKELA
jgi:hypothetical protein